MRGLNELINTRESGWPSFLELADSASNKVEILPADPQQAEEALYNTQVTTRSLMGAIVYHSGGVLIDNGWIRILGSGSPKLNRSLPGWNMGKTFTVQGQRPEMLLIADDAVGGFFMLNGGGLGSDLGNVYYLSPDQLQYEPLGISYTDFIFFCLNGDLGSFYEGLRWTGWETDLRTLNPDHVFSFFPFLWTEEGKDLDHIAKKQVPVEEQYRVNMNFMQQIKN